MARLDDAKRIFSFCEDVAVERDGETVSTGRGIISAVKQGVFDRNDVGRKAHPMGLLTRPTYRFTGYLPEVAPFDDVINSCGAYRVLTVRHIRHVGRELCVSLIMEKKED